MKKSISKTIFKGVSFSFLCASLFLTSCSSNTKKNWNPKNSDSSKWEDVSTYKRLLAPANLKYDASKSILSWSAVDGARAYVVNLNGEIISSRVTTCEYEFTLSNLELLAASQTSLISVRALAKTDVYEDSPYASITINRTDATSNFTYRLSDDDQTLEITGFANNIDTTKYEDEGLTFPNTIDGFTVTRIADRAFYRNTYRFDVSFEEGYLSIGESAFYNSRFVSITLPTTLKTIEDHAFQSSRINTIILPRNIETLGVGAFQESYLETVTFDENISLQTIPENCFDSTSLQSVVLPASVKQIEKEGFARISTLKELKFAPDGKTSLLESIGESAFIGATSLKNIVFPASLREIKDSAFASTVGSNCSYETIMFDTDSRIETIGNSAFIRSLNSNNFKYFGVKVEDSAALPEVATIVFPKTLKSIGISAFQTAAVVEIQFEPGSVIQNIDNQAFYQNSRLVSVQLPASLETIGESAFNGCTNLEIVDATSLDAQLKKVYANSFNGTKWYEASNYIVLNNVLIKDVDPIDTPRETLQIAEGIKYIANGLYSNGKYTSITLPNSLIGIYESAFSNNSEITAISIPSNVEFIDQTAFYRCEKVETLIFEPNSHLQTIGVGAFSGLKLSSIRIPDSVITIDSSAFSNNTNVSSVIFEGTPKVETIGANSFYGMSLLNTFTLPDSVKTIGQLAFAIDANAMSGLTSFEISNQSNLQFIGNSAFSNQQYLTTFKLPDSVEIIDDNAFYNTKLLQDFQISNTSQLKELHASVFDGSGITSFTLPASMEYLSNAAFSGASALTNVTFDDQSFANALEENQTLFADTFRNCLSLREIHLPQHILNIERNAFNGCSNLLTITTYASTIDSSAFDGTAFADSFENGMITLNHVLVKYSGNDATIVLPNDIITINENAFVDKTNLVSITLPASLVTIKDNAFANCENLTTIVLPNNAQLETIGNHAFANCYALTNFNFTSHLKTMGEFAFLNCRNLGAANLASTQLETIPFAAFANNRKLQEVTLPETLQTIDTAAFYFDSITSISIPSSVVSVAAYAFAFNISSTNAPAIQITTMMQENTLETIVNHKNSLIENISNYDFTIENLSFALTGQLETVGTYAFSGSKITELLLPNHDNASIYLEADAFSYATKLTKVSFEVNVSFDLGVLRGATSLQEIEHNSEILTFTAFGNTVTSLPKSLEKIVISDGSTKILDDAFNGYSFIKEIVLPDTIQSIGKHAFYGCRQLTQINLENVETIGDEAFVGCVQLSQITMGTSLTKIGNKAFMATAYLNGKQDADNPFIIENGILLLYTGNEKEVTLPEGVVRIAGGAFSGNATVEKIIASSQLKYIDANAFDSAIHLTNLDLTHCTSIVEIGLYLFNDAAKEFKVTVTNVDDYVESSVYWKLYRDYLA